MSIESFQRAVQTAKELWEELQAKASAEVLERLGEVGVIITCAQESVKHTPNSSMAFEIMRMEEGEVRSGISQIRSELVKLPEQGSSSETTRDDRSRE